MPGPGGPPRTGGDLVAAATGALSGRRGPRPRPKPWAVPPTIQSLRPGSVRAPAGTAPVLCVPLALWGLLEHTQLRGPRSTGVGRPRLPAHAGFGDREPAVDRVGV